MKSSIVLKVISLLFSWRRAACQEFYLGAYAEDTEIVLLNGLNITEKFTWNPGDRIAPISFIDPSKIFIKNNNTLPADTVSNEIVYVDRFESSGEIRPLYWLTNNTQPASESESLYYSPDQNFGNSLRVTINNGSDGYVCSTKYLQSRTFTYLIVCSKGFLAEKNITVLNNVIKQQKYCRYDQAPDTPEGNCQYLNDQENDPQKAFGPLTEHTRDVIVQENVSLTIQQPSINFTEIRIVFSQRNPVPDLQETKSRPATLELLSNESKDNALLAVVAQQSENLTKFFEDSDANKLEFLWMRPKELFVDKNVKNFELFVIELITGGTYSRSFVNFTIPPETSIRVINDVRMIGLLLDNSIRFLINAYTNRSELGYTIIYCVYNRTAKVVGDCTIAIGDVIEKDKLTMNLVKLITPTTFELVCNSREPTPRLPTRFIYDSVTQRVTKMVDLDLPIFGSFGINGQFSYTYGYQINRENKFAFSSFDYLGNRPFYAVDCLRTFTNPRFGFTFEDSSDKLLKMLPLDQNRTYFYFFDTRASSNGEEVYELQVWEKGKTTPVSKKIRFEFRDVSSQGSQIVPRIDGPQSKCYKRKPCKFNILGDLKNLYSPSMRILNHEQDNQNLFRVLFKKLDYTDFTISSSPQKSNSVMNYIGHFLYFVKSEGSGKESIQVRRCETRPLIYMDFYSCGLLQSSKNANIDSIFNSDDFITPFLVDESLFFQFSRSNKTLDGLGNFTIQQRYPIECQYSYKLTLNENFPSQAQSIIMKSQISMIYIMSIFQVEVDPTKIRVYLLEVPVFTCLETSAAFTNKGSRDLVINRGFPNKILPVYNIKAQTKSFVSVVTHKFGFTASLYGIKNSGNNLDSNQPPESTFDYNDIRFPNPLTNNISICGSPFGLGVFLNKTKFVFANWSTGDLLGSQSNPGFYYQIKTFVGWEINQFLCVSQDYLTILVIKKPGEAQMRMLVFKLEKLGTLKDFFLHNQLMPSDLTEIKTMTYSRGRIYFTHPTSQTLACFFDMNMREFYVETKESDSSNGPVVREIQLFNKGSSKSFRTELPWNSIAGLESNSVFINVTVKSKYSSVVDIEKNIVTQGHFWDLSLSKRQPDLLSNLTSRLNLNSKVSIPSKSTQQQVIPARYSRLNNQTLIIKNLNFNMTEINVNTTAQTPVKVWSITINISCFDVSILKSQDTTILFVLKCTDKKGVILYGIEANVSNENTFNHFEIVMPLSFTWEMAQAKFLPIKKADLKFIGVFVDPLASQASAYSFYYNTPTVNGTIPASGGSNFAKIITDVTACDPIHIREADAMVVCTNTLSNKIKFIEMLATTGPGVEAALELPSKFYPSHQFCNHTFVRRDALIEFIRCVFVSSSEIMMSEFSIQNGVSYLTRTDKFGMPVSNNISLYLYSNLQPVSIGFTSNFIGIVARPLKSTAPVSEFDSYYFVVYQVNNEGLSLPFSTNIKNSYQYAGEKLDATKVFDQTQVIGFETPDAPGTINSFFSFQSANGEVYIYKIGYLQLSLSYNISNSYGMDEAKLESKFQSNWVSNLVTLSNLVEKIVDQKAEGQKSTTQSNLHLF